MRRIGASAGYFLTNFFSKKKWPPPETLGYVDRALVSTATAVGSLALEAIHNFAMRVLAMRKAFASITRVQHLSLW